MIRAREHEDIVIGEVLAMLMPVSYSCLDAIGDPIRLVLLILIGRDAYRGPAGCVGRKYLLKAWRDIVMAEISLLAASRIWGVER